MKHDIITLTPFCELSQKSAAQINTVAGHQFDNNAIQINFGKLILEPATIGELVEVSLAHIGIDITGYLTVADIERLLGLELKYLEQEYISYLIAQNLSVEGIRYLRFIDKDEVKHLSSLMTSIFSCNRLETNMYVAMDSMDIDPDYLHMKPQSLSPKLKLSVSWAPFETSLSTDEITSLSSDDMVMVYSK
ncbi:hypothetical protein [Vibrio sagamiensis]|uniref:Uncharacterized protein n=1 Tax=Vibrio sagamiensis NBRC 104589 TaxID=1219064 RepID=A0A511QJX8_9VIBR|nr:hypothetical protein [Vibrio sagamiensis]PNQ54245.1 hypothetical protein C1141_16905 [Vibrio agarivorans]GEM77623.1 hypothetical protein VSA01S_37350 [Vibrio sagamiensis NBRC 104589]